MTTISFVFACTAATHDKRVNRAFIHGLREVSSFLLDRMSKDLQAFSRHAKRKTIMPDDVLLAARKNDAMVRIAGMDHTLYERREGHNNVFLA